MDEEFTEDFGDVEVVYLDEDHQDPEDDDDDDFGDIQFTDEIEQEPPPPDLAKLTFIKHSRSVFCSDLTKDGQLAATGGEDDMAYVWSTSDGSVLFECTGHKDSVTVVCFNHDNQLLATGDMSGMIQVWDVKGQKLVWCNESDDLEWMQWHPLANVLLYGSQSGDVYIWQVPQSNCKILPTHGSSCTCACVLPDGKHLLTGYADGHVKLWDIKTASSKWHYSDPLVSTVNSLAINSDGTLCSLAPSSSVIKVSDGKLISRLVVEGDSDIESHVFADELNLLITGSLNGQLCVWDLSKQTVRHQAKLDCGITVFKLGLNGKFYVGTTAGTLYVCNARTGLLEETFTGHTADILSISAASDGRSVLTTSDDNTAKIFQCLS